MRDTESRGLGSIKLSRLVHEVGVERTSLKVTKPNGVSELSVVLSQEEEEGSAYHRERRGPDCSVAEKRRSSMGMS
jgi:hypothetical protein